MTVSKMLGITSEEQCLKVVEQLAIEDMKDYYQILLK